MIGPARACCTALLVVMLDEPCALAQSTPGSGAIEGAVSTQQATPLAGVGIKIIDPVGRIVADGVTDAAGRFRVANLSPGTYRVMAALEGFEAVTQSVSLGGSGTATVAVDLPIARLVDTIDVVGETTAIASSQTLARVE